MKKICFLLSGFQKSGGIERVTSTLANALSAESEIEVHTIAYVQEKDVPLFFPLDERIQQHDLYDGFTTMKQALLKKKAIQRVRRIVKDHQIDVLIACGALYFPLARLATWGTSAKCWCWEHTDPAVTADHQFQMVCRKFGIRFADKLIVLTKAAAKSYVNDLGAASHKMVQIYHPVPRALAPQAYAAESKKIISVGRLSYAKNFSLLLDIASDVLPKYPGWTWDIYGEGEERQALEEKILRLGLQDRVHLKGAVNDLSARYPAYAFLVMTSRFEGFGMVLAEGMAAGLPLVSFDVPSGPNEIISHDRNGLLVPPEDRAAMGTAITRLIEDENLRVSMSAAAKERAKDFSMKAILRQWTDLFGIDQ